MPGSMTGVRVPLGQPALMPGSLFPAVSTPHMIPPPVAAHAPPLAALQANLMAQHHRLLLFAAEQQARLAAVPQYVQLSQTASKAGIAGSTCGSVSSSPTSSSGELRTFSS